MDCFKFQFCFKQLQHRNKLLMSRAIPTPTFGFGYGFMRFGRWLFSSAVVCMFAVESTLAAQWPIKDFVVFFGEPWSSSHPDLVEIGRYVADESSYELDSREQRPPHIPQSTVIEIENYLGLVARRYEALGFLPPKLEPFIKQADGRYAYRVYLYDTDQKAPASYSTDCAGGVLRRIIRVDLANPFSPDDLAIGKNGTVTDKGYQHLAHELFHAVQASYPLFAENCALGDWIGEGTADALGVDLARELRGVALPSSANRWGMRRYYTPLRVRDDPPDPLRQDAYKTASFWRYAGEKVTLSGGIPGLEFVEPDYSYLHDFFMKNIDGGASENTELRWLNERLLEHPAFLQGLSRIYPYFISTFAGYVNTRLTPSATPGGDTSRNMWLGEVFGKCLAQISESGYPPARLQLELKKVAAGCWMLHSDISSAIDVSISARGPGAAQLSNLVVGTANGAQVGAPVIVSVNGEDIAFWLFSIRNTPGVANVFVISNVAEDPALTTAFKVDLEISASAWTGTISAP